MPNPRNPPPRQARSSARRREPAGDGGGVPRWLVIVGVVLLIIGIRIAIRAAGHH